MSREIKLRKSYGYEFSSGRMKNRRVVILRSKGFSVLRRTHRKKSHFLSKNSQDIGLVLSNPKFTIVCHILEMNNLTDYISLLKAQYGLNRASERIPAEGIEFKMDQAANSAWSFCLITTEICNLEWFGLLLPSVRYITINIENEKWVKT